MIDRIDKIGLMVGLALVALVLELVRRKQLREEYSFLWVAGAIAVLVMSVRRDLFDRTAIWLGVYYPPSLLLLVLLVIVFVGSLTISVALSRQRRQIERLMEDTAILSAELRDLRDNRHGTGRSAKPRPSMNSGGGRSNTISRV